MKGEGACNHKLCFLCIEHLNLHLLSIFWTAEQKLQFRMGETATLHLYEPAIHDIFSENKGIIGFMSACLMTTPLN